MGTRKTAAFASKTSVDSEIAHLRDLRSDALHARWKSVTGREAPAHLPRHLLFAMLAYRIQSDAFGDIDAATLRLLKQVGVNDTKEEIIPLVDDYGRRQQRLLPGTILTREWNGQAHRVMVASDGYVWEGSTYQSLSQIARLITATKWNGPRFFGLRAKRSGDVQQA